MYGRHQEFDGGDLLWSSCMRFEPVCLFGSARWWQRHYMDFAIVRQDISINI